MTSMSTASAKPALRSIRTRKRPLESWGPDTVAATSNAKSAGDEPGPLLPPHEPPTARPTKAAPPTDPCAIDPLQTCRYIKERSSRHPFPTSRHNTRRRARQFGHNPLDAKPVEETDRCFVFLDDVTARWRATNALHRHLP